MSLSEDCPTINTIWATIFDLPDLSSTTDLTLLSDGTYSKTIDPTIQFQSILSPLLTIQKLLLEQQYRYAHNLERLELDMKLVKSNYESLQCPQLVVLILLYRFIIFHPKMNYNESIESSKQFALTQIKELQSAIQLLLTNDEFIQNYSQFITKWQWILNDTFIITFEKLFQCLLTHQIPIEYGTNYNSNECSMEYNTIAWVIDIDNHIYGTDEWTFNNNEECIRKEYCYLSFDDFQTKRQNEFQIILKTYPISFIPIIQRDYGKYIKDNFNNYDFSIHEPYEEDLTELEQSLPPLP